MSAATKKAPAKKVAKKRAPAKKVAGARREMLRRGAAKKPAKPAKAPAKKSPPAKKSGKVRSSNFAANQEDLAKRLGVSRATVARLMRKSGCPVRSADGRYDVPAFKEFYDGNKEPTGEDKADVLHRQKLRDLDLEKKEIDVQQRRFEFDLQRGLYCELEEVKRVLGEAFSGTVQAQRDAETAIAPEVAGCDYPEALNKIRASNREALSRFALGDWAKKKPFWRDIFAALRDLQATLNPGSGLSAT